MHVIYKKSFKKSLAKQPIYIKKYIAEKILLLLINPHHPSLRVHTLKGKLADLQSLDITPNIRIHFFVYEETCVLVDIGTHSELY